MTILVIAVIVGWLAVAGLVVAYVVQSMLNTAKISDLNTKNDGLVLQVETGDSKLLIRLAEADADKKKFYDLYKAAEAVIAEDDKTLAELETRAVAAENKLADYLADQEEWARMVGSDMPVEEIHADFTAWNLPPISAYAPIALTAAEEVNV